MGKDGRRRVVHYAQVDGKTITSSESYARYLWRQHYGDIPEGLTVDHIDGDKANDAVDNLQLLPQRENARKHHRQNPDQARQAAAALHRKRVAAASTRWQPAGTESGTVGSGSEQVEFRKPLKSGRRTGGRVVEGSGLETLHRSVE